MIILLFACTDQKKEKQKVIAQIDNRTISQEDFILRAELSPEMSYSGPVEKRAGYLLELLVNEKLAALAAEKMGLDKSAQVQQIAGFIEDMALSRELYRREVQSKVSIANAELEQAMKRQRETCTVAYLSFRDRTTAQLYQGRLCAGMTFSHALRELYGLAADTTSNRRVIKWGENDPALEEAAYQLEIGQISSVLPVAGGFMVAKLQDIEYSVVSTEADEARRKERGQRILTARKDAEISARFVVKFMQNQRVRFNEPIAADLANTFVEQAMAYQNTDKAIKPDRPLEQQGWINARQTLRHRLDETFVSFAGGQFSLREILEKWHSFNLPIDHREANACRLAIARNISLIVRDTLLAREARRRGYAKLPSVQKDVQMWRDYYLYAALEAQKRSNTAGFSWHEYLAELKSIYAVQVDSALLRQIQLTDIPVIAVRPGQYSALVTPPWPSFN